MGKDLKRGLIGLGAGSLLYKSFYGSVSREYLDRNVIKENIKENIDLKLLGEKNTKDNIYNFNLKKGADVFIVDVGLWLMHSDYRPISTVYITKTPEDDNKYGHFHLLINNNDYTSNIKLTNNNNIRSTYKGIIHLSNGLHTARLQLTQGDYKIKAFFGKNDHSPYKDNKGVKIESREITIKILLHEEGRTKLNAEGVSSAPKVELSEGSVHIVKMLNSGKGGQMVFEPAVIKVSKGDIIDFKAVDMAHNSASIDGMIPDRAPSWKGSLSNDIRVKLDVEGVYVYQCDTHAMMAMVGVIQVGKAINLSQVKKAAGIKKSSFIMNQDRLETYLSQL